MLGKRKSRKKANDKDTEAPLHRIGSFPKHMSRSWPADIGAVNESDNGSISSYCSTTDLTHSYDSAGSSVTISSWLGKMLTKFGLGTRHVHHNHHSTITQDYGDYPTQFPYNRFLNESKVSVYSNNLRLDESFHKLSNITVLRLTKNIFHSSGIGITGLPRSFAKLNSTLKELDLRGNPLQTFPDVLFELTDLTILNMENCELSIIPIEISSLRNLKKLYVDNNQIVSPISLSLQSLDHLSLGNNRITDISEIKILNIQALDLSENFITEIPEDMLNGSKVLKQLVLRGNSIKKLPKSICTVNSLKRLDISKNLLKRLPDEMGELTNLRYLNISWNDLTALPKSITSLPSLKKQGFFCGENPLQMPPYEVAVGGPQSIASYFRAISASKKSNRRLKLMVLGNEKTGKTTLAKAIYSYTEPEPQEERTIGLDFFEWQAEAKPDGLKVLIVDCAGQKKYVLTHQLFMQTGSVFAVVVNLNEYKTWRYDEAVGDWIDLILARIPKAVIMIVPTFIDLCTGQEIKERCEHILRMINIRAQEINKESERELRGSRSLEDETPFLPSHYLITEHGEKKKYPQNDNDVFVEEREPAKVYMVPVSNKNHLEGLTVLREEIVRISDNQKLCPNVKRVVPESWVTLEELCKQEMKVRKTITVDEIFAKVSDSFETKDDLIDALKYVDSLGPILYFHSIPAIRDVVFVDPVWFSSVFKLIFRHDSEEFFIYKKEYKKFYEFEREFNRDKDYLLSTAALSYNFLRCIWHKDIQDGDYFNKVVALLKSFDLAYDITLENHDEPYMLVPWFLSDSCQTWKVQPDHFRKKCISCVVETNVKLPDGFFQRFIVKVYQLQLFNDTRPWVNGFIALTKNYRVKVIHQKIKGQQSCITIEGYADDIDIHHTWEVLIPLLQSIQDFVKEWPGIKYKMFSVCPSCKQHHTSQRPEFWQLDLEKLYDETDSISCHLECEMVDKWLVFPPPSIAMQFFPHDLDKTNILEHRFEQELTADEKDRISGVISNRCREFCRALGVHKGALEEVHSETNWRDRVIRIINIWEEENDDVKIRQFVERMNLMRPLPHDVINICLSGEPEVC